MPIDDALEKIQQQDELREKERIKKLVEDIKQEGEEREKIRKKEEELLAKDQEKIKIELNDQLEAYKKQIKEQIERIDKQKEIVITHLKELSKYWPEKDPKDEYDNAVIKLVTDKDFPKIYKNALILKKSVSKQEYILMNCIEKQILNMFQDFTQFFEKLSPLGLNLLCPYYKSNKTEIADKCLIDGDEIYATCNGRHDICVIFKDRSMKFTTGELLYVKPPKVFKSPPIILTALEQEQLEIFLLKKIEEYWRGDD